MARGFILQPTSPALANAITGFGREILLWSKASIEERGYRVVYGNTDSLFVVSGEEAELRARRQSDGSADGVGE